MAENNDADSTPEMLRPTTLPPSGELARESSGASSEGSERMNTLERLRSSSLDLHMNVGIHSPLQVRRRNRTDRAHHGGGSLPRSMLDYFKDKKPFQEGSLQKKTVDDPFKRWQTRYFRLEDGELKYWASAEDAAGDTADEKVKGCIPLELVTSVRSKRVDQFDIVMGHKNIQHLHLRAGTADEKSQWLFAFRSSISIIFLRLRDPRHKVYANVEHIDKWWKMSTPARPNLELQIDHSATGMPFSEGTSPHGKPFRCTMALVSDERQKASTLPATPAGSSTSSYPAVDDSNFLFPDVGDLDVDDRPPSSSCPSHGHTPTVHSGLDSPREPTSPHEPARSPGDKPSEIGPAWSSDGRLKWRASVHATQGNRSRMEDAHMIDHEMERSEQRCAMFGIFDGHCGSNTADWCSAKLGPYISSEESFNHNLAAAITSGFAAADSDLLKNEWDCGSCVLLAFVRDGRLTVANLGDCQGVLCRGSSCVRISEPHRPDDPPERARIEEAGGWITLEEEMMFFRLHTLDYHNEDVRKRAEKKFKIVTTARINGDLAVSRSMGDRDFKGIGFNDFYKTEFKDDLVCAVPVITDFELVAEDRFIVLACDGLYDVLEPEEVVELACKALETHHDPCRACRELVDEAIALGSTDNITVMLIELRCDA